ncbi:GNAT family N-acetyltransferase [Solibacillus sp. FSL H8-0538]|uniref:GNAT family N-acetyltransferase n=1 Tax=Solibacillus sp. FSL H8-0538 TaxID=2921400 RepID=UPI0030FCE586
MFYYQIDEELSLKLVTTHDTEEIYDMIDGSRVHLREWLGWLDTTIGPEITRQFTELNLQRFAKNEALDTAIVYKGKIVGKIGFNSINWSNKTAQIGYMLAEGAQGKGIMTRSVKAMTAIAFEHYGLHKVEIHVAEGNVKSRAIPARIGYTQEGMIRSAEWLYDHYVDHIVYGMLRKDWQ